MGVKSAAVCHLVHRDRKQRGETDKDRKVCALCGLAHVLHASLAPTGMIDETCRVGPALVSNI